MSSSLTGRQLGGWVGFQVAKPRWICKGSIANFSFRRSVLSGFHRLSAKAHQFDVVFLKEVQHRSSGQLWREHQDSLEMQLFYEWKVRGLEHIRAIYTLLYDTKLLGRSEGRHGEFKSTVNRQRVHNLYDSHSHVTKYHWLKNSKKLLLSSSLLLFRIYYSANSWRSNSEVYWWKDKAILFVQVKWPMSKKKGPL